MPNHCDQDLYVTGDINYLKEFIEFSKTEYNILDHNKYIPYPEKFKLMDEASKPFATGYNSGGYEWCREKLGNKMGNL